MEQLIIVGIIILFSVLEAAARKKRGSGEGQEPTLPSGGPPEVRLPRMPEPNVGSYDEEPSFDDLGDAGARRASSEGLIPTEVWEEIQAMARGGREAARRAPVPTPAPPPARPPARPSAQTPAQTPARASTRAPRPAPRPPSTTVRAPRAPAVPEVDAGPSEHPVHLTHAQYGRPIHDRLTGFDEDTRGQGLSAGARALHRVLRGGGPALRQAVLLHEILGPPVSLKDDPSAG